jgi:hypothetical protein
MASIELLPRKEFIIKLDSGEEIKGKFGTWALKRFCLTKNYTLQQLTEALTTKLTIDDAINFILSAVESSFRELKNKESFPYNDIDVCAWIDEMGGFASEDLNKLFLHASDEEKKSQINL